MAKTFGKAKGRRESGTYTALPHALIDHPDFANLSASALRVLICLARQYNGRNNGDLSAPLSRVKESGVKSSASLSTALDELKQKRWIICTRMGRFMKPGARCSLYGLTWLPINECPGKDLEHPETVVPLRSLSLEKRAKNLVQ